MSEQTREQRRGSRGQESQGDPDQAQPDEKDQDTQAAPDEQDDDGPQENLNVQQENPTVSGTDEKPTWDRATQGDPPVGREDQYEVYDSRDTDEDDDTGE